MKALGRLHDLSLYCLPHGPAQLRNKFHFSENHQSINAMEQSLTLHETLCIHTSMNMNSVTYFAEDPLHSHFDDFVCLCWEFYDPVSNEVMSSRSVNSGTVPGLA